MADRSRAGFPAHAAANVFSSFIAILVVGLLLTTLLEEWFIGKRVKRITEGFLMLVLKANLVAFLIGAGIGAAIMLPKRLHSPGFLAVVVDFLSGISLQALG